MYYHINAFKQTDKKKYQLDFALEGDLNMIKDWLEEKEIITLGINEVNNKAALDTIGTIQATIFHHADQKEHTLITHHQNIAQACLMLMFLGFDVRRITDTQKPLPPEKSDKLIAIVQKKIKKQKDKIQQKQTTEQNNIHKEFEDERLLKLKSIAKQTQQEINDMITKTQETTSPNIIKQLQDINGDLQKLSRGTNANTISITLKKAFSLMEEIELHSINQSKEEEIHLMKDSLVSHIDVLNEYNKRQKASQIKKVGEKSTDADDKYYTFFGKVGIYIKFLQKEYINKFAEGNYLTNTITQIITYTSILLPIIYACVIIRSQFNNHNINTYLVHLSYVALYAGLWNLWYNITKKNTFITLIGIPIVIGIGYIFSLIIYNTFAL